MSRRRVQPVARVPSATGYATRLAYARAKAAGVALRPILAAAGLTREQLEEREGRLEVRAQIKFLDAVARALADDLLGFHLARDSDPREGGLFYYVLASSSTLADAFQRVARYTSIVNEGVVQRCLTGRCVGVEIRYAGVNRHFDRQQMEFWITTVLLLARQLTGTRLAPSRVRMVHARRHGRAELSRYLGRDAEFGAAIDEISFPKAAGDLPVVNADPHLNRLLVKYCEEALAHRSRNRWSFSSRVEDAIVPLLPHARARAAEIASRLGMSQRTLARRLMSEGLSFSEVLYRLRLDLANHYLNDEELSVSRVAWLLGYQNVAAFSHAFKRWTGKTPSRARPHAVPGVGRSRGGGVPPAQSLPATRS